MKKFGDRKDGKQIRNMNGMNYIMNDLLKSRCDNEVYANYTIDVTELVNYVKNYNKKNKDQHLTYFHVFSMAIAKTIYNRPYLNRFVANGKFYQRNEVLLSFVAKMQFEDNAQEVMQVISVKENDNLFTLRDKISNSVNHSRSSSEDSTSGTDDLVENIGHLPKFLRSPIVGIFKFADRHDLLPLSMTKEILYYSSVILSNLGSIGSKHAIYHHLSTFGTNSILITMGKIYKQEIINDDNSKEIRSFCDFGVTMDERIADGFYIIKSVQLLDYILNNPKLLEDDADAKVEVK